MPSLFLAVPHLFSAVDECSSVSHVPPPLLRLSVQTNTHALLAAYRIRSSTHTHAYTKTPVYISYIYYLLHLQLCRSRPVLNTAPSTTPEPTSSPPWEGGMSPQLKELLLPQFVQDRKSSAMDDALEGCDLSYVYYTTDSSSSDIASPLTPTFSNRGGVPLRYSSSTSSLELPALPQEGPVSPNAVAQHAAASKLSIRQLPDVQEEPLEREQEYDEEEYDDDGDNLSDTFGMYCLCKLAQGASSPLAGWLTNFNSSQAIEHASTKRPLESFCETKSPASMTLTTTSASSATATSPAMRNSPGRSVTSAARPWRPSPRASATASPALPDGRPSARQTASRA